MRTTSDIKYRPIRRCVSRYGKIESALKRLKNDSNVIQNGNIVTSGIISSRTKMEVHSVARILTFTRGIRRIGKGLYEFTDEEIRVE